MKFSVSMPTTLMSGFENGESAIVTMARAAEKAGFHACSVTDHPVPTGRWLDHGGHIAHDPFAALGLMAGVTKSIKLQTAILVVPYRNPFITARAGATVDTVSDGRLILGVGVGYLKGEYKALGVDHDTRNDITDEYLDAIRTAWSNEEFTFKGTGYEALGNRISPPTPQRPHPPIWVGGNAPRAIRRAVQHGDAWMPFYTFSGDAVAQTARTTTMNTPADLKKGAAYMHEQMEKQGRTKPLTIAFDGFNLNPFDSDQHQEDALGEFAGIGVTWAGVHFDGETVSEWCDNAQAYAQRFLGKG